VLVRFELPLISFPSYKTLHFAKQSNKVKKKKIKKKKKKKKERDRETQDNWTD
jgi:hypothetical protein